MDSKWTSRKFWLAVAAFLASLGTGITGLVTDNETVALVGGILTVVSAAIYAFCEAYVDAASVKSTKNEYVEQISVTSTKDDKLSQAAADKVAASVQTTEACPPSTNQSTESEK